MSAKTTHPRPKNEPLGGYYLIEAKDLDEAIDWPDWPGNCPGAKNGSIEVRTIMVFE